VTPSGTSEAAVAPPAPAPARRSHRALTLIACIIVVVLLAELATRAIASGLPAPLQWQSYETQKKVEQIDALSRHGGAQLVFLGSSLVDLGVEPNIVAAGIGPGVTSYNAGLDSSIPRMTAEWAEHIVIPELHPRVLVLGVGAYDLDGSNPSTRTAFYTGFMDSAGAKRIMDRNDLIQNLNQWLGQHSSLWYNKVALRDPETVLRAIFGRPQPSDPAADEVLPDGRQTTNQYVPFVNVPRLNISNWTLGTKDSNAIKQLIGFCEKRHIRVVLVNMPVTKQFINRMPEKSTSFATFSSALFELGLQTHTQVLQFQTISNTRYFSDEVHLGHAGAGLLSQELGAALKPLVGADLSGH
jgi:hypothetical protein